jgi:hypothetical protein
MLRSRSRRLYWMRPSEQSVQSQGSTTDWLAWSAAWQECRGGVRGGGGQSGAASLCKTGAQGEGGEGGGGGAPGGARRPPKIATAAGPPAFRAPQPRAAAAAQAHQSPTRPPAPQAGSGTPAPAGVGGRQAVGRAGPQRAHERD